MRGLLVAVTLSACAARSAPGPAWPKSAATANDDDGGESLAPHQALQAATAIEKSDDDVKPAPPPVLAPVIAPSAEVTGAAAPATAIAPAPPAEEPITTEEIVIEIDD